MILDCKNLCMPVGKYFRKLCTKHTREKYKMSPYSQFKTLEISKLSKTACSKCGWNKSYTDRHRLRPGRKGGKYEKGNVVSLCPNCHRIETTGLKPWSS